MSSTPTRSTHPGRPSATASKHSRTSSHAARSSLRSTNHSIRKTSIIINVYDLLPPGRVSSVFWTLGVSLLHSGVVINDREYAFGGHERPGVTGVYWTKPRQEPPGGTWRCELLHGFTYATPDEIEEIIRDASKEFVGPSYNLLSKNCNHFTSHLCAALTGQPAPAFLNRAASIGVALPCVVPAGWIEPPECEPRDEADDRAPLTGERRHSIARDGPWGGDDDDSEDDSEDESEEEDEEEERRQNRKGKGRQGGDVRDSAGRELPAAERARVDRVVKSGRR